MESQFAPKSVLELSMVGLAIGVGIWERRQRLWRGKDAESCLFGHYCIM